MDLRASLLISFLSSGSTGPASSEGLPSRLVPRGSCLAQHSERL